MDFPGSSNTPSKAVFPTVRASIGSRVSRLFSRRNDSSLPVHESHRTSAACEVPIFMSPSFDRLDIQHVQPPSPEAARSLSPTHPIMDVEAPSHCVGPYSLPASSVYSESPGQQYAARFEEDIRGHVPMSPPHDLEEGQSTVSYTTSETRLVAEQRRKRRRRVHESIRSRIEAKKRLSLAFGITVLAAIITCMSLEQR